MRRGYKETEIGEIPEEWEVTTLESCIGSGFISDGDWIESKDQDENGTIRLIQLADIGDGDFIDKSARYINEETFLKLRCTEVVSGDILIARMPDPIGRACIFPKGQQKSITAVDVCIVRVKGNSNKYICFTINSPAYRNNINQNVSGTTRQRVPTGHLKKIQFPLPPLPEQKKIAEVLSSVDELIRATQAVIEQAKVLKQGMLNRLLTKGIGHKKFKQTEIGEIPEEWEVKTLRELSTSCEYGIGASAVAWSFELPRYLRITDIDDMGNIIHQNRASIDVCDYKLSLLNEGDLLFARTGNTVGKTCLFSKTSFTEKEVVYAGYLIRFIPNRSVVIPMYLFYFTQSQMYRKWVVEKKRVGAQPNINAEEYSSLLIPFPPLHEQKMLVEKMKSIDNSIIDNMEYLDRLKKMKSGLMQDLLSGKKRVKV